MKLHEVGIGEVRTLEGAVTAPAILREIESLLGSLVTRDEGGVIDLRSLPLTADDIACLEAFLGVGEVFARVDSLGLSHVHETGVAGVWWIIHQNEEEEVIGQFIEVTYCPEILMAPVEDVRESRQALRARLLEEAYGERSGDDDGQR